MNNRIKTKTYKPPAQVMTDGWTAVVEKLGAIDAARFFQTLTTGKGDSVKEYHQVWAGMGMKEIHQEVLRLKKAGLI